MNIADFIFNNTLKDKKEKTAIIWRGKDGSEEKYAYGELDILSNKAANMLKEHGIKPGDRVFIYLERIPELYFFALGILKCGAVFCPLFSSFGPDAVADRVSDCGGKLVITQPHLADNVKNVQTIVINRADGFRETLNLYSSEFNTVPRKDEDLAVIHYTSGTTGKPKGAMHQHKSVQSHYSTCLNILHIGDDDIYWVTADPAWVTGTSYGLWGPLSVGATMFVCDPPYRLTQFFRLIEEYKVSVLYTAPTLLRMLMRENPSKLKDFSLNSLKRIFSVGEPLNPEIYKWAMDNIHLPIYDTWFQTETGSIMVANWGEFPVKSGSMGKEVPGMNVEVLDENFKPAPPDTAGHLAIMAPWPSMFAGYWNNEEKYKDKFKNGWYISGDLALKDDEGYIWFLSREDDVINTAGHLVSPFEVENIIIEHPSVAEVAALPIPDKIMGQLVKIAVVLKDGYMPSPDLELEYRMMVRNKISPFAAPQVVQFMDEMPKTSSGKIIRRLLI